MNLKRRYVIVFSIFTLFALYLLLHFSVLMLSGKDAPQLRTAMAIPERAAILDRNGRYLALQLRFADVAIWRPSITDIDVLANELSPVLEMPAAEIRRRINNSESNFLYLKRQIEDSDAKRLNTVLEEKRIRGVMVQPVVGRLYPEKTLASQVIGFVGDGNRGLEGIEFAFNDILNGIDNDGKGSAVVLTLDTNVQYILERIAARTLTETRAEAVMLLAMDPRSGDILGSFLLPVLIQIILGNRTKEAE